MYCFARELFLGGLVAAAMSAALSRARAADAGLTALLRTIDVNGGESDQQEND